MAVRVSTAAAALKRTANLPSSTAMTIAGWFHIATVPARFWGPIGVSAAIDGSNFMQISSAASGSAQLQLLWVNGAISQSANLISVTAGSRYFLALTCSGTATGNVIGYARDFRSNALTSVSNTNTRDALTNNAVEWGRDGFTADFMDGAVSHAVMFDRVLTANELLQLSYDLLREKVTNRANLNTYYRLRGANDIQDLSGNARPFTATVGVDWPSPRVWPKARARRLPAAPNANVTLTLTGVSATGAVGTVGVQHSQALTGNTVTGTAGNVTGGQPLTGVGATGAIGTVGVQHSQALTGVSATGAVGIVTPNLTIALTGVGATGVVGTLVPNTTIGLTGVGATGAVGTVTPDTGSPDITLALTGNQATGAAGTLGVAHDQALTGNSSTGSVGTLGVAHDQALTGNAATGALGTLSLSTTVALTGVSATGQVGTVSVASSDVTIALTGVSASGEVGSLTASGGDVVAPTQTGAVGGGSSSLDQKSPERKRREEQELEEDIRRIYRRLTTSGVPAIAAKAEAIAEVITSSSEVITSTKPTLLEKAEVELRAARLTLTKLTVDKEIALRMLEQELRQKRRAENMRRIQIILQMAA